MENTVNVKIKTKIALLSWPKDAINAIIIDLSALTDDIVLKGLRTLKDLRELSFTLEFVIIYGRKPVMITVISSIFHASLKYEPLTKITPFYR